MCGIVGAFAFGNTTAKEEKMRQEAMIYITTQLLQATVERGKDATGMTLIHSDGNYTGLKMGIQAPEFIVSEGGNEGDFEGQLKIWREYKSPVRIFMGHCRKASVGNSYDNKNNQPIKVEDILCIHNGTLDNHNKIFENLGCAREGDVDSEGIGRLLHFYTQNGTIPFNKDMIFEIMRRLEGTFSVIAASGNNPYQAAQFRVTRPAEWALVKPLRTVFVASEKKFFENVFFEYNKFAKLFAQMMKLPTLGSKDVEFKIMEEDSMAIWNLAAEITPETKLADLVQTFKGPAWGDRIWKANSATTYGNTTSKKAEVNAHSPTVPGAQTGTQRATEQTGTGTKGSDPNTTGLVWSKTLNKFKTQDGITTSKSMGHVEIDPETGVVSELKKSQKNFTAEKNQSVVGGFKPTNQEKVEELVASQVPIEKIPLSVTKSVVTEPSEKKAIDRGTGISGTSKCLSNVLPKQIQLTDVDMTTNPEAIAAAETYVEGNMLRYEKDAEVLIDIDAADEDSLRQLPLFSLANRIKKAFFKKAFIAGYIYASKTKGHSELAEQLRRRRDDKISNAESKIRTLKLALRVVSAMLTGVTQEAADHLVAGAVESFINKPQSKLRITSLADVFSVGDLKAMPIVKALDDKLKSLK